MISLVGCGDTKGVSSCKKLDGTYWITCIDFDKEENQNPLYRQEQSLVKFENGKVYSGHTGHCMPYICTENEVVVKNICTFSLNDDGQLIVSVKSLQVPFRQITACQYDSIVGTLNK